MKDTDRDFPIYEITGGFEKGKPARPFPTRHLHKAFDKDSDNTIPIIFGGLIIGLLWTVLGAGFL